MKKSYIVSLGILILMLLSITIYKKDTHTFINIVEKTEKMESAVTPETSTFTIINKQNDSENTIYTYSIKLSDVTGAVRYKLNGKEAYLLFDAKGNTSIEMSANATLILYDIPVNTTYVIEQNKASAYKTRVNDVETTLATGITEAKGKVTFDNETTIVKSNPVTADYIEYIAIILLFFACIVTTLRTIKVKKYE